MQPWLQGCILFDPTFFAKTKKSYNFRSVKKLLLPFWYTSAYSFQWRWWYIMKLWSRPLSSHIYSTINVRTKWSMPSIDGFYEHSIKNGQCGHLRRKSGRESYRGQLNPRDGSTGRHFLPSYNKERV